MDRIVARWDDAASVPLLKEAGVQAVFAEAPGEALARECKAAGIVVLGPGTLAFADLKSLDGAADGTPAVFTDSAWPGLVQMDGLAGATSSAWLDANLHWVAWLRALWPKRAALLGHVPNKDGPVVPHDSLELALIEARVMGGNYLLALPSGFREALIGGEDRARQAWARLGRTAQFLREHAALFGQPLFPQVTVLVEGGEPTAEIANLLFRQSVSPALAPAADPPAPDARLLVLVAVDIEAPSEAVGRRILAHAAGGATVMVNGTWWRETAGLKRLREDPDREIFALGRGRVAAYQDAIVDPGAFAYDVIDFAGQERRACRIWNAPSAIAVAAGRGVLCVVNYGRALEMGVLARIHGKYSTATLLRPEAPAERIEIARRGGAAHVDIPQLRRLAVVVFE